VLADGMGGHAGGALASGLACRFFLDTFAASCQRRVFVPEARLRHDTTPAGDVRARLAEALDAANAAIADAAAGDRSLTGMGCTLVGTALGPDGLEWVSVGDSPLYLVRDGEIVLLNEDHSLAPEIDRLAAMGRISWEAARADPRRHVLRSALTGAEIEMIDRSERPLALQAGDVVVLASDGIHSIAPADIARLASAAATPAAAAEALLAAVEAVGDAYQDNTTVVVMRVSAP
jgi:protein phosphatase